MKCKEGAMDQAKKQEIRTSIDTALDLLRRASSENGAEQGVAEALELLEEAREGLQELLWEVTRLGTGYMISEPHVMHVMDSEKDAYNIYDAIGWLRVMQRKKGGSSRFMLYWQGIHHEPMSLFSETAKSDPRDVEVEALGMLLEDRRGHAEYSKAISQGQDNAE
jgi:hypothetical protein